MSRERAAEFKPLSFSTTMRNPERIAYFVKQLIPYEGEVLTNEVVMSVARQLIKGKLYKPNYISTKTKLKETYKSENNFSEVQITEIIENSPQDHQEKGFDKGWPSRFDTWFKLAKELGFVYYGMGEEIKVSETGHKLVETIREEEILYEDISSLFLNALAKYQTNNPFRKNLNCNAPLPLLLKTISLLKEEYSGNDAGINRKELSLLICWPNNNAEELCSKIVDLRKKYGFQYSDEVIYDECLKLLNAENKRKRFKLSQITGELVDEFIRKMRITGVVSLRGNGRFLDINYLENDKVEHVITEYYNYPTFENELSYFEYMGQLDEAFFTSKLGADEAKDIKIATLKRWAKDKEKEWIINEIRNTCGKKESKDEVLRFIDKPARLEFLISVAITQQYNDLEVYPNYSADDEGLPTFTAAGGKGDIECVGKDCCPLIEVTLLRGREQAVREIPAIVRHTRDRKEKYPERDVFTLFIAPIIHEDTIFMTDFAEHRDSVSIIPFGVDRFIDELETSKTIEDMAFN